MTRRAALLTVVSAAVLLVARVTGPVEGRSVLELALVLLLVVAGIAGAVAGARLALRAVRRGGDPATGPLVVCGFLVLWGLVIFAGTVGRYVGWH